MRRDSRLSVALHVLLHMVDAEGPVTSERLAASLEMNAVVLRRMLSMLRAAGILRGEKGHGGGWTIARDIGSLSLRDVYEALGEPTLFVIGPRDDSTRCPIEQAVDRSIGSVLADAETFVRGRLATISIGELLAGARGRRSPRAHQEGHHHV